MQKKILVISGILPVNKISHKKNENDILLITEKKIKEVYNSIDFDYLFVFPYANRVLSLFSNRWKSYYLLSKNKTLKIRGKNIYIFPLLLLPFKTTFRNILIDLYFFIKKDKIESLIKEIKPDILHAQASNGSAYLAKKISKRFNLPYFITVRGINRFQDQKIFDNMKRASKLIALSPLHLKFIPEDYKHKTVFIPHGIDKVFFSEKVIMNDKKIKLIAVARLIELKNFDILIKALSHFESDFIFDIYGDGPERDRLNEIICQHDLQEKVFLKGFIDHSELPSVYPKYNLFVMISYPETLGRVYFEAMASGLPIIGAKGTGVDGLIHEGKQGVLFNPFTQDFETDFLCFLKDFSENLELRMEMSDQASKFAQNFSWNKIVRKYGELYGLNENKNNC